jgi:hypothetical protein
MGLVAKIPYPHKVKNGYESGLDHSIQELDAYQRVMRSTKKYKPLRRYMPDLVFVDKTTGLVLMKDYSSCRECGYMWRRMLQDKFARILGIRDPDVESMGNLVRSRSGKITLLDLGRLFKER